MSYDWRKSYFNKSICDGVILTNSNGNIIVKGNILSGNPNAKVIYWAASPATETTSFSGNGLPFPNPDHAFENSVNIGAVQAKNGAFEFKLFYPNSYYVGLGSLYVPPYLHIKLCSSNNEDKYTSIKLGPGMPFRTLTHPAPPTENFRVSPNFYVNKKLTVRSQEQILRDSAYPKFNVIPPEMPDNFWGLRPPL